MWLYFRYISRAYQEPICNILLFPSLYGDIQYYIFFRRCAPFSYQEMLEMLLTKCQCQYMQARSRLQLNACKYVYACICTTYEYTTSSVICLANNQSSPLCVQIILPIQPIDSAMHLTEKYFRKQMKLIGLKKYEYICLNLLSCYDFTENLTTSFLDFT